MTHEPLVTITLVEYNKLLKSAKEIKDDFARKFNDAEEAISKRWMLIGETKEVFDTIRKHLI